MIYIFLYKLHLSIFWFTINACQYIQHGYTIQLIAFNVNSN